MVDTLLAARSLRSLDKRRRMRVICLRDVRRQKLPSLREMNYLFAGTACRFCRAGRPSKKIYMSAYVRVCLRLKSTWFYL